MAAPLFKREDIIYRRSGAEIGRLEAFKIAGAQQISSCRWMYEVIIYQRPPSQPSVGDRVRPKLVEPRIWLDESELITLCEAVNIMVARLNTQLANVETTIAGECSGTDIDVTEEGVPKFNIDDRIWISQSARIGFFEDDIVIGVREIGVQPGSKQARFQYKLRRTSINNKKLIFREDELLTKCEAAMFVRAALDRQLMSALAIQQQHCVS